MKILLLSATALSILIIALVIVRRRRAKLGQIPENLSVKQSRHRIVSTELPVKEEAGFRDASSERAAEKVSRLEERQAAPLKSAVSLDSDQSTAIPEDSLLRRHYLSNQKAAKEAISNPYPTDSFLKRHYDSARVFVSGGKAANIGTIEQTSFQSAALCIPEDSVLKRHFFTKLRADVESGLSERPSDSALRRHYDCEVNAKIDAYLKKAAA